MTNLALRLRSRDGFAPLGRRFAATAWNGFFVRRGRLHFDGGTRPG